VIDVPPRTHLNAVAACAGVDAKYIKRLNNDLKKLQTPPSLGSWEVRIPSGSHDLVAGNLSRLHPVVTTGYKTHVVAKGDSLSKICRRYALNKTTLLKANSLRSASLKKGQRLRIPYQTTKYVLLKEGETPESRFASAGKGGRLVLHTIKQGETIGKISRQYNVPAEIIVQWNGLESVHRIRAGQHLALYLDRDGALPKQQAVAGRSEEKVEVARNDSRVPILAGVKKHRPGSRDIVAMVVEPDQAVEAKVTYYKVRNGDNLWTIARKFRVSAGDLRRWNNLRTNMIHPGKRLVVGKS
jgi:membrane-bound lytic murein transglycosylase D